MMRTFCSSSWRPLCGTSRASQRQTRPSTLPISKWNSSATWLFCCHLWSCRLSMQNELALTNSEKLIIIHSSQDLEMMFGQFLTFSFETLSLVALTLIIIVLGCYTFHLKRSFLCSFLFVNNSRTLNVKSERRGNRNPVRTLWQKNSPSMKFFLRQNCSNVLTKFTSWFEKSHNHPHKNRWCRDQWGKHRTYQAVLQCHGNSIGRGKRVGTRVFSNVKRVSCGLSGTFSLKILFNPAIILILKLPK